MSGRRSSSVEGTETGIFGMRPAERAHRNREFRRRAPDQHRDGVLELRALHADVEGLRLGGENLGLGRRDIRLRYRIPAVELVLHDLQRGLVFLDRAIEQFAQRIRGAEIEIGGGERPLRRKLGIVEIGGAGLRAGRVALDLPAHFAPDVEVPGAGELRHEGRRVDGAAGTRAERAGRGLRAECGRAGARAGVGVARRHCRKQRRLRFADEGARLLVARRRRGHRLVRDLHLLEQEGELGIAIEAPPIAAIEPSRAAWRISSL